MVRRLAVTLLTVGLSLAAHVAGATGVQASTTATTPSGRPATECVSASPRPECLETPEFDRSSRSHLLLFAVLGMAIAGIAAVVVGSTVRHGRARHASDNIA